jgi:hypothetical protein
MLGIKKLGIKEHAETSRTKNTLVVYVPEYVICMCVVCIIYIMIVEEEEKDQDDVLFEEEACKFNVCYDFL